VRFTYYLAIPVVVLAGQGAELLSSWSVKLLARLGTFVDNVRFARPQIALTALLAAALAAPSVPKVSESARLDSGLQVEWFDALQWMRANTPEPFDDPDAYYVGAGTSADAYGVLAWWDFGYWISRIARRVPTSNPRQSGIRETAAFYMATDPARAREAIRRTGARYIFADWRMPASLDSTPRRWTGYLGAMATTAGRSRTDYCGMFRSAGDPEPVMYCYPEYYRTMAIRLYLFGGAAVAPGSVWVLATTPSSTGPETIVAEWSFTTYEEAVAFTSARPAAHYRIVSKIPWESCVPLEALDGYTLAHRSLSRQQLTATRVGPSAVQIYEVTGSR
jgi:hypothetical protein